ncbi:guanitoxin biosynthesis heme-dependent pre-guanitoxin N-hydroxylase GntA [Nafulsella turpanensis]|uniref:guanitoxin biosynthesis heme-dependent pre-guanitoxin N-hydroxylase GntA n=1 Tax=Nafulsella turpanensis TaxID=1265690 RepID=UPI000349705C|nr:guanitoxin biosynthesis heme-dependent pre-guanitoxin N-hydroxylase GntA [Nafulsella turpanensis]
MTTGNPFNSTAAKVHSNYINPHLSSLGSPQRSVSIQESQKVESQLRNFILDRNFPCLAAKASFNTNSYRVGVYRTLGGKNSSLGLSHDLLHFIQEQERLESDYTSFLAAFLSPIPDSEKEFEQLLWNQLQELHRQSSRYFEWDSSVSQHPDDPEFSFSFGGTAFYVVGMHPSSSRKARSFPYPLLVFNPHRQFEELKQNGTYSTMKAKIRERDQQLQGSLNPMLQDFGEGSEAKQYSGRNVAEGWKCPFHP